MLPAMHLSLRRQLNRHLSPQQRPLLLQALLKLHRQHLRQPPQQLPPLLPLQQRQLQPVGVQALVLSTSRSVDVVTS